MLEILEVLKDKHPHLLTTQGLSQLLVESHLVACGKDANVQLTYPELRDNNFYYALGEFKPEQVILDENIQESMIYDPVTGKIKGDEITIKSFIYDLIVKNINAIQLQFQISGIVERKVIIRSFPFTYLYHKPFMALLEGEAALLKAEVAKVVKFFELVLQVPPYEYNLYLWEGEDGFSPRMNIQDVYERSLLAITADIYEDAVNGSNHQRPDMIVLDLQMPNHQNIAFVGMEF